MTDERDLYEVLGLPPDCDADEIRRAFRVLAMKHHPDRGGDDAVMAAIQHAYDILSDPEKRAAYNKGELGQKPARTRALDLLLKLWEEMVADDQFNGLYIASARETIKKGQSEAKTFIHKMSREPARLNRLLAKVTCKGEDNFFRSTVERQLEAIAQRLKHAEDHSALLAIVLELLDEYEDAEQARTIRSVQFSGGTTTSGFFFQ